MREIAVQIAAPAPVDVEQPVVVVTIAHKGMTTGITAPSLQQGSAGIQLVSERADPIRISDLILIDTVKSVFITEIVLHRIFRTGNFRVSVRI